MASVLIFLADNLFLDEGIFLSFIALPIGSLSEAPKFSPLDKGATPFLVKYYANSLLIDCSSLFIFAKVFEAEYDYYNYYN